MEKLYLTIIIVLFSSWCTFGQNINDHFEIDTITVFPNRVLVDYKSFSDTILNENIQATRQRI